MRCKMCDSTGEQSAWAAQGHSTQYQGQGRLEGGRVPEGGGGIGPEGQVKEIGLLFAVINKGIAKSCFLSLRNVTWVNLHS